MSKPKVFVTRVIPDKGLELIKDFCEVDLWEDRLPPSREDLSKRVQGVDGLLCLLTDTVDGDLLDAAGPQLKVISNYAVGFDNVNVDAATARKIPVGNTPDVLTDATADFAFTLMMSAGPASSRATGWCATAIGRRGSRCFCSGSRCAMPHSGWWALDASARQWRGARWASICA